MDQDSSFVGRRAPFSVSRSSCWIRACARSAGHRRSESHSALLAGSAHPHRRADGRAGARRPRADARSGLRRHRHVVLPLRRRIGHVRIWELFWPVILMLIGFSLLFRTGGTRHRRSAASVRWTVRPQRTAWPQWTAWTWDHSVPMVHSVADRRSHERIRSNMPFGAGEAFVPSASSSSARHHRRRRNTRTV